MAHFAKIDENDVVVEVITVNNGDMRDPVDYQESEVIGIAHCKKLYGGEWIQTSYNNNFRKRFAGKGYTYNREHDVFLFPKPYESWTLNTTTFEWDPPVAKPTDDPYQSYDWDEENQQWVAL